jgi:hypothetical protein
MTISHKITYSLILFTILPISFIALYFLFFKDYTLIDQDLCAHYVIEHWNEHDILVIIDDISIKQGYLVCLLDENKWLDDEVSDGSNSILQMTLIGIPSA